MKLYLCRECGEEFEWNTENSSPQCANCNSVDIILVNNGFIEYDPEDGYETDEESEPGSMFDDYNDEEEEDCT